MKVSTKKILGIFSLSTLLLILLSFVLNVFRIREYNCVVVLILSVVSSIILFGFEKNRESNEKNISLLVTLLTLLYQIILFVVFGVLLGFLKSGYKLGLEHFFKIVLPILLVIGLSEILRYQFISKGKNSKIVPIITVFFFTLIDFSISYGSYELNTLKGWFEITSFVLFPSVMKNVFLTYNAFNYGYKTNIIYRLIMEVTAFYLPIVPNYGEYLQSVLNIVYPFVLLVTVMTYNDDVLIQSKTNNQKVNINKLVYGGVTLVTIVYALLMSGLFKYYFLAVGSGSMEPKIAYGDMVLVEKTDDYDELKVGDVLVFRHGDKVMLHRIIDINHVDGSYVFKTKGDNNNTEDNWEVTEKNIIGKINVRLMKAGYPTLWLNKLFQGGK